MINNTTTLATAAPIVVDETWLSPLEVPLFKEDVSTVFEVGGWVKIGGAFVGVNDGAVVGLEVGVVEGNGVGPGVNEAVGWFDIVVDLKKLGEVVGLEIIREFGGGVIIENIENVGTRVGKLLVIGTGALEKAAQLIGIMVGGEI